MRVSTLECSRSAVKENLQLMAACMIYSRSVCLYRRMLALPELPAAAVPPVHSTVAGWPTVILLVEIVTTGAARTPLANRPRRHNVLRLLKINCILI